MKPDGIEGEVDAGPHYERHDDGLKHASLDNAQDCDANSVEYAHWRRQPWSEQRRKKLGKESVIFRDSCLLLPRDRIHSTRAFDVYR